MNRPHLMTALAALSLLPTAFANSGGGGLSATNGGSFRMYYNASLSQTGTMTQCVAGLVPLPINGQQEWSMRGDASSTTDTNRPASYLAVWMQMFQNASAAISFNSAVRTSGPVSAVSTSVTNNRKCFSEPLISGWRTVSSHKARPMPNDPDASRGDVYVEGHTVSR